MPKRRPVHPDGYVEDTFRSMESFNCKITYSKGIHTLFRTVYTIYRPNGTEMGTVSTFPDRCRDEVMTLIREAPGNVLPRQAAVADRAEREAPAWQVR